MNHNMLPTPNLQGVSLFSSTPNAIVRKEHFIQRNGEFWMPGNLLGEKLGFGDPVRAMSKLYNRSERLLAPHASVVNLTTPGGEQRVRAFTPVGCLLVCMKANTERAMEVQEAIAQIVYAFGKLGAQAEQTTRQARKHVAQATLELFCSRSRIFTIHKIKKVVELKQKGFTSPQLAKQFKTSVRHINLVRKLYRESRGIFVDLRPEHFKKPESAWQSDPRQLDIMPGKPSMEVMV